MQGTVFHIQRFSLHDGPGVRTVVFLKGCPLRCLWCHNPEGMRAHPQLLYAPEKCIGCGLCAPQCPNGLHAVDSLHTFSREGCAHCGLCADACVSGALQMAGTKMTVTEALAPVLADRRYYKTDGGVTLSGGEPLLQWEFALSPLTACRWEGIGTCMETSGHAPSDRFAAVAAQLDTLYLDYKATGEETHRRLTGVGQALILQNLETAQRMGIPTVLRCPIIPDYNDTEAHFAAIARIAESHSAVYEVHLQPYHRIGLGKSTQLGDSTPFETRVPEAEEMRRHAETVQRLTSKPVILR